MNLPAALRQPQTGTLLIIAITFLAFALRIWQLSDTPPGWRDDELINSLVISQKVLDGDWQLYYADASGHEALYHALNAVMLAVFGPNSVGIRLLSVFLGTLAIPLTWLLGRKLFGTPAGLLAAAALACSFWGLMYARIGLRHVSMPVVLLLAFYFFWRALASDRPRMTNYALAGVWMGIGFYLYFASRGVPMILLAFCGYKVLVTRPWLKQQWRGILLMFVLAALLAAPLFMTLSRQPASEARVSELAVPLVEARQGNFGPLQHHVVITLSMFHADGDGEWLYNMPHRPVFGPLGALFFWAGAAIALYYALKPMVLWLHRRLSRQASHQSPLPEAHAFSCAFLLIWWLAGISPGFISVPPASLGHAILAQPAAFMLMALPVWRLGMTGGPLHTKGQRPSALGRWLPWILGGVLLVSMAARDWYDYFTVWPQQSMVRFLYRADLHELAAYLNEQPAMTDFAVPSLLAGPWDRLALQNDLRRHTAVFPRWYHPERAVFVKPSLSFTGVPDVPFVYEALFVPVAGQAAVGHYTLAQVDTAVDFTHGTCFQNGLCLAAATYDAATGIAELTWQVARPLTLPPFQLISNPPPPGVYAGPRLLAFGQLLDEKGDFMAGEDGFWVDPYTLQTGDIFRQQHHLQAPPGQQPTMAVFGLYDPLTGERILTDDGRDHMTLEIEK